jgi:starch-binding outer membrane protein, SusD/RagB family
MKKTNFLIYINILVFFAFLTSCEGLLDIEPQQSVSAETVYSSHEGVVNALNGAWERNSGSQLFAGNSVLFSELIGNSGEINWIGTFIGLRQLNWKAMSPSDGFVTGTWTRAYNAINLTNNVLASLEVVNENSQSRVEGEAKFLRGIIYFELVKFYAEGTQGVPLVLTPTIGITEDSYVSRATTQAVYDQIIQDLGDAKSLLEAGGAGANGGRATSTNASAFLARVYLTLEQWENAANEATTVINQFGGADALHAHPRDAFNNDSYTSEDVFMINQNPTSHAGQSNAGIATFWASLEGLGRGDVNINQSFLDRFEEGDLRANVTDDSDILVIADVPEMFYIGIGTDPGSIMSSKWGKHDANIPVIRLAEMFLIRAEANIMNGSTIGNTPLNDINVIRARANVPALESVTMEELKEERKKELAFEGHRLHDLRRWNESVVAPSGSPHADETIQHDDGRLILPVPLREIEVNSNLTQNTAYN